MATRDGGAERVGRHSRDVELELEQLEPVGESRGLAAIAIAFVKNSPWVVIAALAHVLVLAIASVWYLAGETREESDSILGVSFREMPLLLPPPVELVPELRPRDAIPLPDGAQEGPVNPDKEWILDAPPGKKGEIFEGGDLEQEPGPQNDDPMAQLDGLPGEPGGTPIGPGRFGHVGSGVVSSFATTRLGRHGRGKNGTGQNGGGGPGGKKPDAADTSVLAALVWLRNHQSPDGRWDADGFDAQCTKGHCDGHGEALHDVGLTGLALLCFLGAGETSQSGPFKNNVKNGVKFLLSQQREDGCFGGETGNHFQYNHACAALALAEAYGMTQYAGYKAPAQRGLDFVMRSQNPYRAWRYGIADGDNDSSVTGWMVMALKSGKMAGLAVDDAAIRNAVTFIDEMTDPQVGRTGYHERGGLPARVTDRMEQFPGEKSESLTAVGLLVRIFGGRTPKEDPLIGKGADLLAAKLPKWDESGGGLDLYYWYYGSLAMYQVGGAHWDQWNAAMKSAILDHQHLDRSSCLFGSWDPIDAWSIEGGRIYSTALNGLCMEVYYRYPRVFGLAKGGEALPGK